jgi:hypothetical protein
VVLAVLGVSAHAGQATAPDKLEALSEAARKGDVAAVRKLLDEGVDVNTKFRYGVTALAYACDRGHIELVKLLLERGADVNVEDTFYHATPLSWAANPPMGRKPEHAAIVGLLLDHGAKGKEGALRAAVSAGDAAMVEVIFDTGLPPADVLSDALESATRNGKADLVALLERVGAKPRAELKIDPAELARYAGTYRGSNTELVLAVTDGRLAGTAGGQRLTLIARDTTHFGVAEIPGLVATFRVENGAITALTLGQGPASQLLTRVEGR